MEISVLEMLIPVLYFFLFVNYSFFFFFFYFLTVSPPRGRVKNKSHIDVLSPLV